MRSVPFYISEATELEAIRTAMNGTPSEWFEQESVSVQLVVRMFGQLIPFLRTNASRIAAG